MDRRTLLKASIAATAAVALPALSFGTRKAPAGGSFRFPATPVGRAFRQWLEAYNAADIEALRAFHRVYSQAEEV